MTHAIFFYAEYDSYRHNLTPAQLEVAYPIRSLYERVPLTSLASDCPGTAHADADNVFVSVKAAALRQAYNGDPFGTAEQALTVGRMRRAAPGQPRSDLLTHRSLAIDWARQGSEHDPWHQAQEASRYLCQLLEEHRPEELLTTRIANFRRWPSSSSAAALHADANDAWPEYADEVLDTLGRSPRDAVIFVLHHREDVEQAWQLAHALDLDDDHTWSDLAKAYAKVDPLAVLPAHRRLVINELVNTGAQHYRSAARRLKAMRKLAAEDATAAADVDAFIAELREEHYRRPRLQREFDAAGLP